jgi:hypothetical protein
LGKERSLWLKFEMVGLICQFDVSLGWLMARVTTWESPSKTRGTIPKVVANCAASSAA